MRKGHSDRTAEEAIGAASKEWKQMAQLAIIVRNRRGSPSWIEKQEKKFTGIFQRLLTDPIELVEKEAGLYARRD